jgi:hypothetical protein
MFSALDPYSNVGIMDATATDTSGNDVAVSLQRVVRDGAALRKAYQPARMPNLDLSEVDTAAAIDYIEAESRQRAPVVAAASAATAPAARRQDSDPVGSIVDAYLRIQQALAADRIDTIAADAGAIAAAAGQAGAAGDATRAAAAALATTDGIKTAWIAFGPLSDRVIGMVRSSNPAGDPDLSVAYCPMAQKYWMQRGKAIRNPYYGKVMAERRTPNAEPSPTGFARRRDRRSTRPSRPRCAAR